MIIAVKGIQSMCCESLDIGEFTSDYKDEGNVWNRFYLNWAFPDEYHLDRENDRVRGRYNKIGKRLG